ncbi:uncharacterized protein LOC113849788 isoform X2 [Abrus precatorius]|uniref:Uncharacterized protein LOC113849788 isoform X2 n=1 Tax=Abrus precatorius TaxID=3816 RepID=A0A8B8JWN2_ABRPR|nr:uncharacterized protein LOC113849788 isoform X2 [Abrus precatorius]
MKPEKMDPDISRWVLEFLLRSSVPDSLIQKSLTVLPLSAADSRLKKTLLLRTLQSLLLKASLSETTLQIFELLEDLNRNDSVPVTDSMRRAYCAVAVECTVKYLAASSDDPAGEYFDAVRRIWRGRVAGMGVEGRRSELVSGELSQWGEDIEAALWDPRVCERLASLNSRREALKEVRGFLEEAWEMMGPSFLDSVGALSKGKGLCPEGVCEIALSVEALRKREGELEGSRKEKKESFGGGGGDRSDDSDDDDDDDNNDNDDHDRDGGGGGASDDGACMEGVAVQDENQGKEPLEERVVLPAQRYKVQKGNPQLKRKHSALRTCNRGVKISDPEEVEPANMWSHYKYDPVSTAEVRRVRESLKSSSFELRSLVKDPLPDALHMSEVVRSKLATEDTNFEPLVENQSEDVYVPNPDVCKSIVPFQPKNDTNLGKKSSVRSSNACHPNLMERRSNARTFEWDDSMDNLPQGKQPRRRKRKWTSLEEETLRAGVKMFGEGNWASIRNFYSNIFENRSGVCNLCTKMLYVSFWTHAYNMTYIFLIIFEG